jgi:circadian clock protein KaiC
MDVSPETAREVSMTTGSPLQPALTGIPGLDDVLSGGFPRGHIYLLRGDPGVGKTTLGLQFLLSGAAAGEKGLYVTLSETAAELRAVSASHGWSLDGIGIKEVIPETNLTMDEENTLFHPSEVELGETTREILGEVQRVGPSRVVIDSLSEVRLLSQSPLRYRRQILALKQFFGNQRATVLLLDDGSSDPGDIHLETISHGVLRMEHLSPLYGAERRRLRVTKLRGTGFRGGYHDMKIKTGGLVVYPRLVASEHDEQKISGEVLASGVEGLDRMLGGGLEHGTTTLILGPAGTGKSAIASVYAAAVGSRGERAALFHFEEGLGTLRQRSAALGIPLVAEMERGRVRVRQVDPAEMSPGEFSHLVRHAVEADSARLIVIDSLNGYYNSMPEETFLTLHLHELFGYLRHKGVVVLLTMAQHGFAGSVGAPVDLSFLADTVLLLRFFENAGQILKAISVPKKRAGRHETAIRQLELSEKGLHIGEPIRQFQGILSGTPQFLGGTNAPAEGSPSDPS